MHKSTFTTADLAERLGAALRKASALPALGRGPHNHGHRTTGNHRRSVQDVPGSRVAEVRMLDIEARGAQGHSATVEMIAAMHANGGLVPARRPK